MRGGGVIGALPGNLFGLPVHPAREGEGGVGHASGIRGLDIGEPVRTVELPAEEPLVLPQVDPEPQPSEPERVPVRAAA
jgi:hypothetical protein